MLALLGIMKSYLLSVSCDSLIVLVVRECFCFLYNYQ